MRLSRGFCEIIFRHGNNTIRNEWIRTTDHLNPIQVLYQAELHSVAGKNRKSAY